MYAISVCFASHLISFLLVIRGICCAVASIVNQPVRSGTSPFKTNEFSKRVKKKESANTLIITIT